MKITLDITKLLDKGEISKEEYEKLLKLSSKDTGLLAINILTAFGIVAVSCGVIALKPSLQVLMLLGLLLAALGIWILYNYQKQWRILGNILLTIGSLIISGSLFQYFNGDSVVFLLITIIFLMAGIIAKSGLAVSLSVLTIAPLIKMGTGYLHASYFLFVEQPIITILVYSVLSYAAYFLSKRLEPEYERLSIIFSRVSLVMVNFGFWVGSLWGDKNFDLKITADILALLWAAALISTGVWAAKKNKRFAVNTVTTFGAIHFYTQWFERLGAKPITVVVGGIIAIAVSLWLWKYNTAAIKN